MADIRKLSDEEILLLSSTDPSAFEVLVERLEEPFLRKARSILKNEEQSIDAVQDTFVKIYTRAHTFKKQEGANFRSWAYTILIRTCFTAYQKQKQAKQFSTALDDELLAVLPDTSIETFKQKLDTDEVLSLISKLPKIFQDVMKKFYVEGKSQKEIADEINVSQNVVRTRIHRAKKVILEAIK